MTVNKLIAITLTCTSLFAGNAFAHDDYQISCDTNITSNIAFSDNELVVQSTKQEDILFKANGTVFLDGTQVALTTDEQKLAQIYYKDVEAAIPMVVDITIEALKITNMALVEVFTGLLGEDNELPQELNIRINDIAKSVEEHVYQDPNSLTFNSAYLKDDIGLGDDLDQEIDEMKAEIISSVMGQMIVAIGKSMLNGDGDFSKLETRMENLGQDIEIKAEALAEGLKEKSIDLCDKIKTLDETETKLRKVDELRYLNTIHFNKNA
ncbi:MAG: hypothetical protein ACJAVV_003173 [Alphaproteobacteria bacterium]|jgi:hypothetical protein